MQGGRRSACVSRRDKRDRNSELQPEALREDAKRFQIWLVFAFLQALNNLKGHAKALSKIGLLQG